MVKDGEIQVRTDAKNMLVCTAKKADDGQINIIKRDGKKEDTMTVASFLTQVYGRPVAIMFI